jgi:hypothetical protein
MGCHFRKRIRIVPDVYWNVGKKSTSLWISDRGATTNISSARHVLGALERASVNPGF